MDSLHNYPSLSEVHQSVDTTSTRRPGWRKILSFFGPAYLVSVGYMDPGNWATDLAGGSQFGYKLIWVLLMSNLMALLLQSLSARLGIVEEETWHKPAVKHIHAISIMHCMFSRDRNCRM
jgi:manganese transport protein